MLRNSMLMSTFWYCSAMSGSASDELRENQKGSGRKKSRPRMLGSDGEVAAGYWTYVTTLFSMMIFSSSAFGVMNSSVWPVMRS